MASVSSICSPDWFILDYFDMKTSSNIWESYQPNEIAVRVGASAETHWTVTMKELLKERATGEPHPAAGVHAPVSIQ